MAKGLAISLEGAVTCTKGTQPSRAIGTVTNLFTQRMFQFKPGTIMFREEDGKQITEVGIEVTTITKRSEQDAREKYGERN